MNVATRWLNDLLESNSEALEQEVRWLFLDAVMIDPEIARVVVREVQEQMFAFDANRATKVISMIIDDVPGADGAFASMLRDMREH
jgi:hypothetical protein